VTEMATETTRPVPFRAGHGPQLLQARVLPQFTGPHVLLGDVSEFQPDVADGTYLRWSEAIIIRATYGADHDDHAWYGGERRAKLHDGGAQFLGIYQYLRADQDAVEQARALVKLLGKLRPGEKVIADIEEGNGSQHARRAAWSHVISDALGDAPWDYAGRFYAAEHGLQPVDWIADYSSTEPSVSHRLWQFTDRYDIPGVGPCDCSVFRGSIAQLAQLAFQPSKPAPKPVPHPAPQWPAGVILREGDHGEAVTVLQEALNATHLRGVRNITVDGAFGSQTLASVENFQKAKGLKVDGIAGPVTRSALGVR
jgi:putative peptidoglycan binding protein/glycosyl hydrolase family 25